MKRNNLVMVVEDDRDVRDSIVEILEDNSYTPIVAINGQDALDQLRGLEVHPSVILLDVMMSVMDGWQFRAAQMADVALRSIPVVLLTANTKIESVASQMAVSAWLKKPVHLETLLSTVEKFCAPS